LWSLFVRSFRIASTFASAFAMVCYVVFVCKWRHDIWGSLVHAVNGKGACQRSRCTMSANNSPLFLGLDCSTQTLKATVIDQSLKELSELETVINYDVDLPQFGTKGITSALPRCTKH
jgi:hypothetical protein